jgi:hypothetical protein
MAAGITSTVWDVSDLIYLTEEPEITSTVGPTDAHPGEPPRLVTTGHFKLGHYPGSYFTRNLHGPSSGFMTQLRECRGMNRLRFVCVAFVLLVLVACKEMQALAKVQVQ